MKIKLKYIFLLVCGATILSCSKDNYDAPSAALSGRLVYSGESIGLEKNQVSFELYQYGFGKVGPIASSFTQDGTYAALLFNGEYKLIVPNGQGPFMWSLDDAGNPDSVSITVAGATTFDLEVTPYYMIRNPQVAASGGNVNATFALEKIITDANARDIENVTLFINRTQFVSGADNIANAGIASADITDMNNISLSVAIPAITPTQTYVYARVGLKIAGVEDRIFSPLVKLDF